MTRLESLARALRLLGSVGLLVLLVVLGLEAGRWLSRPSPQPIYRVEVVGCVPCGRLP